MRAELSPKAVGRLAAYLFMASGVLSAAVLPLPQLPDVNRSAVLVLAGLTIVIGGIAYLLPWERWSRRSTLALLPFAFVVLALGNYYGSARSYSYSVFFIVAFVWIGITHPRWTSLWFAPLALIAYITPILLKPVNPAADAAAAGLAIPVCVLVAEVLAYIVAGEQNSRKRAQSLARVARALGHHLSERPLCQALVEEARVALGSEHSVLYQLDLEGQVLQAVYVSGLGSEQQRTLEGLAGTPLSEFPISPPLSEGKPVVVEDTENASEQDLDLLKRFHIRSYVAMPVMSKDGMVGILSCWETSKRRRYHPEDISLASALAAQASAAFRNAKLYQQTLTASRSDALTSLGNRRAFRERLEQEVERARRYGRALSMVLIDADRLKSINDAWGHLVGDRVLIRLAETLLRTRRTEDGAYRIGGDEFALVLPETNAHGASILAERLRKRIEHAKLGVDNELMLTVSIGISSFSEHGINADELFERADSALYEVKASGGNAVSLPARASGPGVKFGVDVQAIVETGMLVPYYQPIFDLATGNVIGFETFCRMDPRYGHTPTPTLFKAAAALGCVEILDRYCRGVAVAGATSLPGDTLLFLNVAPSSLEAADFEVDGLTGEIAAHGLSPDRVVIEVTEQQRTPASKILARRLNDCRTAGLRIALDDFGATGADLDLLAGLTFDYVKVDMSFVHGANGVDTRRRVLRGLALLAAETGASAIAEGIETLDDLKLVRELGFAGAQGFLLRDPTPALDDSPRPLKLLGVTEPQVVS